MDITYVPMARGFVYLAAVIDWFSRKVLAWRLSITLSADFCIEALEEALGRHGRPEIFDSDQGSQVTSLDFIKGLKDAEIAISRGGKGAWRDNVFVERLGRTVKYEEVYLRAYTGVFEARASIGRCLGFCNGTRPPSLGGQTPDQAYLNQLTPIPAAASPRRKSTQRHPGCCSEEPSQLFWPPNRALPSSRSASCNGCSARRRWRPSPCARRWSAPPPAKSCPCA